MQNKRQNCFHFILDQPPGRGGSAVWSKRPTFPIFFKAPLMIIPLSDIYIYSKLLWKLFINEDFIEGSAADYFFIDVYEDDWKEWKVKCGRGALMAEELEAIKKGGKGGVRGDGGYEGESMQSWKNTFNVWYFYSHHTICPYSKIICSNTPTANSP